MQPVKVGGPAPMDTGPLAPIQVIPTGFTGLLQLKQLGRLPNKLSDLVAPVIEMRDWYLTSRRQTELALLGGNPTTGLQTAVGFYTFTAGGVTAAVPQNQIWYVEQCSAWAATTAAADNVSCALGIGPPTGNLQFVSANEHDLTALGAIRRVMVHADRGFWAFPGDQFILAITAIASAGGVNFSLQIRATPCPI